MDVKTLRDEIEEIHKSGDCGLSLSTLLHMANRLCEQPSDLEIVQKALYYSNASMNFYSDGSSSVYVEDDGGFAGLREYDFSDSQSLLTWAKQTIGVE